MRYKSLINASANIPLVLIVSLLTTCGGVKTSVIGERGMTVIESDGIILEIPQGALDEDDLVDDITMNLISESEIPLPLPEGFLFLLGVELKPDSIVFNVPVKITIPLSNTFPVGKSFPLLIFDPVDNAYKFASEAFVNQDGNSVSAQINHFSDYVSTTPDLLSTEETRHKEIIIDRISEEVINKFEGEGFCFHDKGLLSFGDIDKVRNRIKEVGIVVDGIIGNSFLESEGNPLGVYCSCIRCGIKGIFFCDDIVLPVEPDSTEVQASTLLHEMMHALFDDYRDELAEKGFPDDEVITTYFERAVNAIIGTSVLREVEGELAKDQCDRSYISNKLDQLVKSLEDPFVNKSPVARDLVMNLTGFDVDPEAIKRAYVQDKVCGPCEPEPSPSPTSSPTTTASPGLIPTPMPPPTTPGQIAIGPLSLNFGDVQVGTCSTVMFAIQHVLGTGPGSGTVSASPPFSISSNSSFAVSNGQGINIEVQFCPTSTGTFTGTATVSSNANFTGANTVTLTGTGTTTPAPPPSSEGPPGTCSDGLDNDKDSWRDCYDKEDCSSDPICQEVCDDGEDNDKDSWADCYDRDDCSTHPFCQEGPPGTCSDGLDNDKDSWRDCYDKEDCSSDPICQEVCDDGEDNDKDSWADCYDRDDCSTHPFCQEGPPGTCSDGLDNDKDSWRDCYDKEDCSSDPACQEVCDDGEDNDRDGYADCADPSCSLDPGCV